MSKVQQQKKKVLVLVRDRSNQTKAKFLDADGMNLWYVARMIAAAPLLRNML